MWESLEGVLFQWWAREGQPRFTQPDGFCCLLFGKIDADMFFSPHRLKKTTTTTKERTNEDIQHVWNNYGGILEVSEATKECQISPSKFFSHQNISSRSRWGRFWMASGGTEPGDSGGVDVKEDTDAEIWGSYCFELRVKYEKELKGRLLKSVVGVAGPYVNGMRFRAIICHCGCCCLFVYLFTYSCIYFFRRVSEVFPGRLGTALKGCTTKPPPIKGDFYTKNCGKLH